MSPWDEHGACQGAEDAERARVRTEAGLFRRARPDRWIRIGQGAGRIVSTRTRRPLAHVDPHLYPDYAYDTTVGSTRLCVRSAARPCQAVRLRPNVRRS